ncbi:hypothetical protein BMF94_3075 [Rhodotorula taiwanensis]|uniref:Rad60/SUMO-like domain-containing protein n=1 Tax=Rhodotorula taiwanensis TaxID=741276 RepID=A0A2S5BAW1_9BASI|nr:hypothetical protein BMF94_3075 [Rhodotorula taiwanensis]
MAVKGDPDAANGDVKVKGTTKFGKIYAAVANQTGKDDGSFIITYDGERVDKNATPEELGFEEEECLDVHIAQVGGAPSAAC